jgi:hypothetical protein
MKYSILHVLLTTNWHSVTDEYWVCEIYSACNKFYLLSSLTYFLMIHDSHPPVNVPEAGNPYNWIQLVPTNNQSRMPAWLRGKLWPLQQQQMANERYGCCICVCVCVCVFEAESTVFNSVNWTKWHSTNQTVVSINLLQQNLSNS